MYKKRSEYQSYSPNSPLTLHYIETGAILKETPEQSITNTPTKRNIRTIKGKVCNSTSTKKNKQ